VKLGLHIAAMNWESGAERLVAMLAEIISAAEAAGFDAISVTDHLWGSAYTGGVEASQVEAYTTLGFIAARTRRARLLALATAASYRHAGLLAKTVTTLDVLSGGRAMLGIGAGDYAEEAQGLGRPFRPHGR
jgi:alkanesulfonate monooxygenase SsuD/methylene tetrahydromethanopterin reductase-like flavin-dependent oxidoreductase (luciferase family)